MNEKYAVLNVTQATTFAIFAEHYGVSLDYLQSREGEELDALCYELAENLRDSLANHFVYKDVNDLSRGYKALSNGGSI